MRPTTILFRRADFAVALFVIVGVAACGKAGEPDAYGSFEATEVVVAAQTSGPVQRFLVTEGQQVARGELVAVIDTTALSLDRAQLSAQRAAVTARLAEVGAQLRMLEVQREIAARSYERTRRLQSQQAATAQQLDQAERDHRTVLAQLDAARAQERSVGLEAAAVEARVAQARDRVSRATVRNPLAGTVLTTYTREGEMVNPGQPLFKVASLDTLVLRAYVSGAQLSSVRIGQVVEVRVQQGADALLMLPGTITWIATQSEFTPTPVQTRDERADLVYAVKVRVANRDGVLKIGMPADLTFVASPATP